MPGREGAGEGTAGSLGDVQSLRMLACQKPREGWQKLVTVLDGHQYSTSFLAMEGDVSSGGSA